MKFLVGSTNPNTPLSLWKINTENSCELHNSLACGSHCKNITWIEHCGSDLICTSENAGDIVVLSMRVKANEIMFEQRLKTPCGGADPTHIAVISAGNRIYAFSANYSSGSVSMITIAPAEACITVGGIIKHGVHGSSIPAHAHHCAINHEKSLLHVCDLGMDTIYSYSITERLSPCAECKLPVGSGPRHAVYSACGRWAFVVCELSNQLVAIPMERSSGIPANSGHRQCSTLPDEMDSSDMAAAEILLSADQRFLYVSNRDVRAERSGVERSCISVFHISDVGDGAVTLIQCAPSLGRHPRHMCLCREGALLLVANRDSNNFVAFPVDGITGLLDTVAAVVSPSDPHCVDPGFLLPILD